MAKKTEAAVMEPAVMGLQSDIRIGDMVIYGSRGGATWPAVATGDEQDGKLDLTAFPRGLAPVPFTSVDCDPDGVRDFSWRRR